MSHEDAAARLSRARTEIGAARLLLSNGFADQATSRAYYAAFYAAEAALRLLGEARSSHSGVISAFGKLAVKEGGFDPEVGALLHDLFDLRGDADYESGTVTAEQADSALSSADRFVASVDDWMRRRGYMPAR